jgi:hypothetical protein
METRPYFDFEWERDVRGIKGYRLVPGTPSKKPATKERLMHPLGFPVRESLIGSALLSAAEPARIVHLGGSREVYRPLDRFPKLYKSFAEQAPSTQGLLAFIGKFGPLTLAGLDPRKGDSVPHLLEHASSMRSFLALSPEELAEKIGMGQIELLPLEAALIVDPTSGGLRLSLMPPDLLCALWLQLGQFLRDGTTMRQCLYCKELFEVGAGADRRLDAKFCSNEHRTKHHNQQRGKGRMAHA